MIVMGFYNFEEVYHNTHFEDTVLASNKVFYGLGSVIAVFGLLSVVFFILHWTKSILPLYKGENQNRTANPDQPADPAPAEEEPDQIEE